MTLSPMLVQYLIGLCCLKWNPDAVDVTIGDMVYDSTAEKHRDVDVTVTVEEGDHITHAFKAYEVKHEGQPLDVATTEQLCLKLLDMPNITHRAIVSSSGFTDPAQKKAARHGVELYMLRQWTRPLKEQFPQFEMDGTAEEHFPATKLLLCWPQAQISLVARTAKGSFHVQPQDMLFTSKGKPHPKFKVYQKYQNELLLRSTEILFLLEPAATISRTFPVPFKAPDGEVPCGPAWPHTHTMDVASDDVFVDTGNGRCRLDLVTISGLLQWQRSTDAFHYYVIEHLPDGKAFAGALVSTEHREGHMTCLVFSPKTREIGIEFVRLAERHHRAIRNLKLDIRSGANNA
jgi:ribosomal protein S18 acetylase RimI-like enzyme